MTRWLSQEWLDRVVALAGSSSEHPGATATMQWVIAGGPDGEVKVKLRVVDGRLIEAAVGADPAAEVTLSATWDDAREIQAGELDLNAAFMQGRVKVAGHMSRLLAVLPLTATEEYGTLAGQVREFTDYQ